MGTGSSQVTRVMPKTRYFYYRYFGIFLLLAALSILTFVTAQPGQDGCGGVTTGTRCYKAFGARVAVDRQAVTFDEAEQACVKWGGHLASFISKQEADAVITAIRIGCTNRFLTFVGLHDRKEEGRHMWIDQRHGSPTLSWETGEPNDRGGEDVVAVTQAGLLNDVSAALTAPCYVCSRPSTEPASQQPEQDSSRRSSSVWCDATVYGEACFKGFAKRVPYTAAREHCARWGGYLASFSDPQELAVIKSVADSAKRQAADGGTCGAILVGLTDIAEEGKWTFTDGTDTTFAFSLWGDDEPNNLRGLEHVSAIMGANKVRKLNDIRADIPIDCAVCKRTRETVVHDVQSDALRPTVVSTPQNTESPTIDSPERNGVPTEDITIGKCINDCSNVGVCNSDGSCKCNAGYSGIDCSILTPCEGVSRFSKCYQAFTGHTTFMQAEAKCIAWGGHLASIHSEGEHQAVIQSVSVGCPGGGNHGVMIGLNDREREGSWKWTDGSPTDHFRWAKNEPNDYPPGEDAVILTRAGWNDVPDTVAYGCFACKKPLVVSQRKSSVGECPNHCSHNGDCNLITAMCMCHAGYRGRACETRVIDCAGTIQDGVCYTAHKANAVNWGQARSHCVREGGDLASIGSREEELFVLDLAGRECNSLPRRVWIGGTDLLLEGSMRWSDGTPMTYTRWTRGEPNNHIDEDYVELTDGGWNDVNERTQLGCFVCKKNLKPKSKESSTTFNLHSNSSDILVPELSSTLDPWAWAKAPALTLPTLPTPPLFVTVSSDSTSLGSSSGYSCGRDTHTGCTLSSHDIISCHGVPLVILPAHAKIKGSLPRAENVYSFCERSTFDDGIIHSYLQKGNGYLSLGVAGLVSQKQLADALRMMRKPITGDVIGLAMLCNTCTVLLGQFRLSEAASCYEACNTHPIAQLKEYQHVRFTAQYGLGKVAYRRNAFAHATKVFITAQDEMEALSLRHGPRAPSWLYACIVTGIGHSVLGVGGSSELAMSWYDRALIRHPGSEGALLGKALVYTSRGELDQALDYFLAAIKVRPTISAIVQAGYLLRQISGRHREARRLYRLAKRLALDSGHRALEDDLLGIVTHYEAREFSTAVGKVRALLLTGSKHDPILLQMLGNLYYAQGEDHYKSALRIYDQLFRHLPSTSLLSKRTRRNLADLLFTQGERHYAAGRWDQALNSFARVYELLGIDPANPLKGKEKTRGTRLMYHLCLLQKKKNDPFAALELCRLAHSMNNKMKEVLAVLQWGQSTANQRRREHEEERRRQHQRQRQRQRHHYQHHHQHNRHRQQYQRQYHHHHNRQRRHNMGPQIKPRHWCYQQLGIPQGATPRQIKAAYHRLALRWHPDKVEGADAKAKAEKKFRDIAEAYETLSNKR